MQLYSVYLYQQHTIAMESNLLWLSGGLIIGLVLGALLRHLLHSETAKNRRLEQQIDQLQRQHQRYQAQVSEHFSRTGDLLSGLNSSYRDIFSHLVLGAERLGNDDEFRSRLPFGPVSGMKKSENADSNEPVESLSPPRDYAPPSKQGTLSENYGFPSPPQDFEVEESSASTQSDERTPPPHQTH